MIHNVHTKIRKIGAVELVKSSLQQFQSQYSGRDPIIWCKV